MHRSGTSAFAGLLVKAGYFAGNDVDLLPNAKDNPTGFYERFDIIDLNNQLLTELGGAWDNPPPRLPMPEQASVWRARVEEVLENVAEHAGGRPLLLKDPRMSLLLQVWLKALGDRFVFILVDRNPMELAMSVRKRDGRPLHVSLALWQLYYAELLNSLAGQRVWFARYESLVHRPSQYTSVLLDGLKAELAKAAEVGAGCFGHDRADAAAFVVGQQRHQRAARTGAQIDQQFSGGQLALSRWLSELPDGWVTLDAPAELCTQPQDALECATAYYAQAGEPAPGPVTVRGALRLAHHHYLEGGLHRVVSRAGSLAWRLARQRS
jgi:hypothetical protein